MTTILGIDVQPTRLGFAVMVDGKPHDCWTTHIDGFPTKIAAALADCPPRIDRIAREWPITRFVSHARRYGAVEARLDDAIFGMWPDVNLVAYKPTEWKVRCGLPGNADKARIFAHAVVLGWKPLDQDAADAACIAVAAAASMDEARQVAR